MASRNDPLSFEEYERQAIKFAIYPDSMKIVYPTLGLADEAGEVCGKVKKAYRDAGGIYSPQRRQEIKAELGDVLWYVNQVAHDLGLSLEDVAVMNLIKLKDRQERDALRGDGDNR